MKILLEKKNNFKEISTYKEQIPEIFEDEANNNPNLNEIYNKEIYNYYIVNTINEIFLYIGNYSSDIYTWSYSIIQ